MHLAELPGNPNPESDLTPPAANHGDLRMVLRRLAVGFYDHPEVLRIVARRILGQGDHPPDREVP